MDKFEFLQFCSHKAWKDRKKLEMLNIPVNWGMTERKFKDVEARHGVHGLKKYLRRNVVWNFLCLKFCFVFYCATVFVFSSFVNDFFRPLKGQRRAFRSSAISDIVFFFIPLCVTINLCCHFYLLHTLVIFS